MSVDEVDFLPADEHKSFLHVDGITLGVKEDFDFLSEDTQRFFQLDTVI